MATWPSSLPNPLRSGYGVEVQDATIRTDMDSGSARVRRRSTSIPDRVTVSWLFDADEMATFRSFWNGDWNYGAAWVTIPLRHFMTSALVNLDCRPVPATFKATPASSTHWQVDITVEVRDV